MKLSTLTIVIIFLILNCTTLVNSQIYFSNMVYNRNTSYVELMGNGRYWTANYEYLFKDFGVKQGVRIGAGVFPNFLAINRPMCYAVSAEYVNFVFSKYHHIEWGAGASFRYETYSKNLIEKKYTIVPPSDSVLTLVNHEFKNTTLGPFFTGRIGYRYQDPDGGLVLRAGWTPLFFLMNSEKSRYDDVIISNTILPFSMKLLYFGISVGWNWF